MSADDPNRAARQCRAAQPLDAVRCDSVVLQFLAVTDFPRSGAPRMNQYGFSTGLLVTEYMSLVLRANHRGAIRDVYAPPASVNAAKPSGT